jgi:hypothetical protein
LVGRNDLIALVDLDDLVGADPDFSAELMDRVARLCEKVDLGQ